MFRHVHRAGLAVACVLAAALPAAAPRDGALTIEQLLDIKHPSSPVWSPDGRYVVFVWERAGVANLWLAPSDGGSPRALTSFTDAAIAAVTWARDSSAVLFGRGGDLWRVDVSGAAPAQPVWQTPESETGFTWSPDGTRVAFARPHATDGKDGRAVSDLWVRHVATSQEVKLTDGLGAVNPGSWAPDGKRLTFGVSQAVRRERAPAYSGPKIFYSWVERTTVDQFAVPMEGGPPVALAASPDSETSPRWIDPSRVVLERVADRYRRRQILVADVLDGVSRVVHEELDAKFLSLPGDAGGSAQPSPDGKWLVFVSDRDGWDRIYVMPSAGGPSVPVTRPDVESWRPAWSPDSTRLAYDTNLPNGRATRHLEIVALGAVGTAGETGAPGTALTLTRGRGTNIAAVWSQDCSRVAYQHTDPQNPADLFVTRVASAPDEPVRLSESLRADVDRAQLVAPERITYKGPDGQPVPADLFVPRGLDRSRRHPAIVWIHGDGINQNYDGWHVQRNYAVYYSFHQYLLQRGYVVLAPDYRGSIGYGKAWRQGVYMDAGNRDFLDAAMSAEYLRTLPYIDGDRIGVWGLSYGGFFTLLALTDRPTWFRCGVNVAGVVDYRMYYEDPYHGGWTVSRIGTPEEQPKVYDVASPLSRVARIERPLLVLHGTSDVNVPYLHSVRLVDALLKHGKAFEFMTYPGELHYFTREHVLRDAWTRVERFFDTHLRHRDRS
jgi:dipeptidyl aminopeptidase/acylaminoacyl peptidase